MKKLAKKVLIIEDDTWFAGQHVRTLEAAGYETSHATDGISGIAAMDGSMPDAVVLDMFLPGPNALVLLHEMQSHSDLAALPVVVCTNNATEIPPGSLLSYGVKAVLDKGEMKPVDLLAAVKKALL